MKHSNELMEAAMQLCYSDKSPFAAVKAGTSPAAESVAEFMAPFLKRGPCPNKMERDALLAALKGLFAHHRVGKAMRGEIEPLVSDTFMDRLQECHRVLLQCDL